MSTPTTVPFLTTVMNMMLPPGATFTAPPSLAPNAQGATPTSFFYTPFTGYIPLNSANARQLIDNQCENNAECTSHLLRQLLESRQLSGQTAYSADPDVTNAQLRELQSYLQHFFSYSSSTYGFQSLESQFPQNSQLTFNSPSFPQQPAFSAQPGNPTQPVVLGQVPSSQVPSPQVVLYNSPMSFLKSIAEPIHQNKARKNDKDDLSNFSSVTKKTLQDKSSTTQRPVQPSSSVQPITSINHEKIPEVNHQLKE